MPSYQVIILKPYVEEVRARTIKAAENQIRRALEFTAKKHALPVPMVLHSIHETTQIQSPALSDDSPQEPRT